eukprot:jgi/Picsp_1/4556/NSC_01926-R1_---NA---
MGRFGGGTNNSSFNGRTTNWQKVKRIKERVSKKRAGVRDKHKSTAIEGVSGKRTGKSQRRQERRSRRLDKEVKEVESGMDIDGFSKKKGTLKQALKKVGVSGRKLVSKNREKTAIARKSAPDDPMQS